jgi:hypothetical protein
VAKLKKIQFRERFFYDQYKYRLKEGFYNTERTPKGKVLFTAVQLLDIVRRYRGGEPMTSIGVVYGCSRQTIRENLKQLEVY